MGNDLQLCYIVYWIAQQQQNLLICNVKFIEMTFSQTYGLLVAVHTYILL